MDKTELRGVEYKGIFYYNPKERISCHRDAHGDDYSWWTRWFVGGAEITNLKSGKQQDIKFLTEAFGAEPENKIEIELKRKINLEEWLKWHNNILFSGGWYRPELVNGTEQILNDYLLERIISLNKIGKNEYGLSLREGDRLKIPRLGDKETNELIKKGILTSPDGQNSLLLR